MALGKRCWGGVSGVRIITLECFLLVLTCKGERDVDVRRDSVGELPGSTSGTGVSQISLGNAEPLVRAGAFCLDFGVVGVAALCHDKAEVERRPAHAICQRGFLLVF